MLGLVLNYVPHMPHKTMNQKPKDFERKKKTIPWRKSVGITCLPRLCSCFAFCLFFSEVFCLLDSEAFIGYRAEKNLKKKRSSATWTFWKIVFSMEIARAHRVPLPLGKTPGNPIPPETSTPRNIDRNFGLHLGGGVDTPSWKKPNFPHILAIKTSKALQGISPRTPQGPPGPISRTHTIPILQRTLMGVGLEISMGGWGSHILGGPWIFP